MKKLLCLLLAAVLLFSLCACGSDKEPASGTDLSEPEPTLPASDTDITEAEPTARDIALSLVDHPVEELYAAIGEPEHAEYAPSCLGDGEDGDLTYDSFTVYTYREDGAESVYSVK